MLHDIHGNAKPCENVVTYGYSFKGIILANIIGVLLVTAAIVYCFWSAPLQVPHALKPVRWDEIVFDPSHPNQES